MEIKNINKISWEELLSKKLDNSSPMSVNMPIHPAYSEFFMHVNPSMSLTSRPVYGDLPTDFGEAIDMAHKRDIFCIDFAFGKHANLANQNRTRFSRIDKKSPVIVGEYFEAGLKYTFKYSSLQVEKYVQDVTSVECEIENISNEDRIACVRLKPSKRNEEELKRDNNYLPFRWNNSRWDKSITCKLEKDFIKFADDTIIGKITSSNMDYELEDKFVCDDEKRFHYTDIYPDYPYSDQLLSEVVNTIKFEKTLKNKEKCNFSINILSNFRDNSEVSIKALDNKADINKSVATFNSLMSKSKLEFKKDSWEDIFVACQNSIMQLTVDFKNNEYLIPTQGGISERHFVWVWEAMFMLAPMISLGHFDLVKNSIKYIFSLQDSGYKPEGEFTSLDGAIGTTAPRWINTTGAAISIAANYINKSSDKEFEKEYLEKIIYAGKWITGQLNTTKKLNSDGTKPAYYGLIPRGVANDGDNGYCIAFTDSYLYLGLNDLVELLKNINSSEYEYFAKELKEYKENIYNSLVTIAEPSGNIPRLVPAENNMLYEGFENTSGAINLLYCNAVDINTDTIKNFMNYFEEYRTFDNLMGKINEEAFYMGHAECCLQNYYLSAKEYKKAWAVAESNLHYGMSRDTYQVLERYSRYEPAWTPWQPNGSGSGRMLTMLINAIYHETDKEIILFAGVPTDWLVENKITKLENLHTNSGIINITATLENGVVKIKLTGDYPKNKKITTQDDARLLIVN